MKPLWFKAKRYGWGWTPATWEGWLVTLAYILILVGIINRANRNHFDTELDTNFLMNVIVPLMIPTVLLLLICYKKGEKPRWRWGGKD